MPELIARRSMIKLGAAVGASLPFIQGTELRAQAVDGPHGRYPASPDLSSHWYNDKDYSAAEPWKNFKPAKAALVLVDLIKWQVEPDGAAISAMRAAGLNAEADFLSRRYSDVIVPNLKRVMAAARAAGVQIIHARLASRSTDFKDIVPALQPYVRYANAVAGADNVAAPAELGEKEGDIVIFKTGSGAFTGTELDFVLRRLGIDTVLYAGVVTNACVLLSTAAGFDLGYRQYLISDCTGAQSQEDQNNSLNLIGSYLAEIVVADDVIDALAIEKQGT